MAKKNILISQGPRPLLHRVLAATLFTIAITSIYRGFVEIEDFFGFFYFAFFLSMFGARFSISKYYRFDLKKSKFRDLSAIGPIEWGEWTDFNELNYVAIFQNTTEFYEVNLWYNETQHLKMFSFWQLQDAMSSAQEIGSLLNLNIYDAGTDPHNGEWIDRKVTTPNPNKPSPN